MGNLQPERISTLGTIGGRGRPVTWKCCLTSARGRSRETGGAGCPARETFAPLRTKGPVRKISASLPARAERHPPAGVQLQSVCRRQQTARWRSARRTASGSGALQANFAPRKNKPGPASPSPRLLNRNLACDLPSSTTQPQPPDARSCRVNSSSVDAAGASHRWLVINCRRAIVLI
jgi:hypothetical protein